MSQPFIAEIKMAGFNFAPRGYAQCNGQILGIAQNTALFSLLGTTYGGNGMTTFGLPNLQGRAVMHAGQGPGLTDRVLGEMDGAPSVTLTSTQLPQHSHVVNVAAAANARADRANAFNNALAKPEDSSYLNGVSDVAMSTGSTTSAGGNTAHNNMQPYLVINFYIAIQGIFPSRN